MRRAGRFSMPVGYSPKWMRDAAHGDAARVGANASFSLRRMHGDRCEVRSRIARFGGKSFVVEHDMVRSDGTPLAKAKETRVWGAPRQRPGHADEGRDDPGRAQGSGFARGSPLGKHALDHRGRRAELALRLEQRFELPFHQLFFYIGVGARDLEQVASFAQRPLAESVRDRARQAQRQSFGEHESVRALQVRAIAFGLTSRPLSTSDIAASALAPAQTSSRRVNHWLCHCPSPRSCSGCELAEQRRSEAGARAAASSASRHRGGIALVRHARRAAAPRRAGSAASPIFGLQRAARRRGRFSPPVRSGSRVSAAEPGKAVAGAVPGDRGFPDRVPAASAAITRVALSPNADERAAAPPNCSSGTPRSLRCDSADRLRASGASHIAAFQPNGTGAAGCSSVRATMRCRA